MKGSACQQRSVAIFGGVFATAGIDAPAVANDQHDRPTHRAQSADGPSSHKCFPAGAGLTMEPRIIHIAP